MLNQPRGSFPDFGGISGDFGRDIPGVPEKSEKTKSSCSVLVLKSLDEGQITHLICARLKYDLYDFFRGCFWAFSTRKEQEAGPKAPPKKVI